MQLIQNTCNKLFWDGVLWVTQDQAKRYPEIDAVDHPQRFTGQRNCEWRTDGGQPLAS